MSTQLGTPNKDGIYFSITTLLVDDNRSLHRPVKDKDGYYLGVPVAVLGTTTRNKTNYAIPEFINQLKGPSTYATRIQEGVLKGEWGHPFIDPNSQTGMARLLHIEPKRTSNHIRSTTVKHIDDLNLDMIMIDTKETGPYGKYFAESMEDPTQNTAFSLRGISKATYDRNTGVTHKKLLSLVTFDSGVVGSGYKQSTKRYMSIAQESLGAGPKDDIIFEAQDVLNRPISPEDLIVIRNISLESFTNTEINDIMKAHKVTLGNVEIGIIDPTTKTLIEQETGQKRSLFHSFAKVKR